MHWCLQIKSLVKRVNTFLPFEGGSKISFTLKQARVVSRSTMAEGNYEMAVGDMP